MRRLFSNPVVKLALALLLLLVTIYIVADLLRIPKLPAIELVGVVGLLVIVGFAVYRFISERRLPWKLKSQAEKAAARAGADAVADLSQLEQAFEGAFEELTRLRPRTSVFGTSGADHLPWVVILGPSGAGKSTALQQSGLKFTPLGRRVHGIGGTRNCAWWLAEEAILLDTAGRYTTQEEDHEEWIGFLRLLGQYRRERPIDAVVLQVGLDEFERLSPPEIEELSLELQRRLDELMRYLEVRFPVHLVFSKIDGLDGFSEYFAALPHTERGKPLGFSLDSRSPSRDAIGERFGRELDTLQRCLVDRVAIHQGETPLGEGQLGVLLFPGELERRRESLKLFTEALFQSGRYREQPWLEAVYFISATQEGVPLSSLRDSVAGRLGIPPGMRRPAAAAPTPYFVRGLYERVLEVARVTALPTRSAQRKRRLRQALTVLALSPLCVGTSWLMTSSYLEERRWLTDLEDAARDLVQHAPPVVDQVAADPSSVRRELTRTAKLLEVLQREQPERALAGPHARASALLGARLDRVWIQQLEGDWNLRLKAAVDALEHSRTAGAAYADAYLLLKAEYVLEMRPCTGADPDDTRRWISDFVLRTWQEHLGGSAQNILHDDARRQLEAQLGYFFSGQTPSSVQLDPALITRAETLLKGQRADDEVLYRIIVASAGLTPMIPQIDGTLLEEDGLQRAYTATGCEKFTASMKQGHEWWGCLLGIDEPEAETDNLEEIYRREYRKARLDWLGTFRLERSVDGPEAASKAIGELLLHGELEQVFKVLAGGLTRQELAEVAAPPPARGVEGWLGWVKRKLGGVGEQVRKKSEAVGLSPSGLCAEVREPFQRFDRLVSAVEGGDKAGATPPGPEDTARAAQLTAYRTALQDVQSRLEKVAQNVHRNADALTMLSDLMNSNGELFTLASARRKFFEQLEAVPPDVDTTRLNQALEGLEAGINAGLLPLAMEGIEEDWESAVSSGWETQIRVPIKTGQVVDACVRRFEYLQKNLVSFVKDRLTPLYERGRYDQCAPHQVMGRPLPFDTAACRRVTATLRVLETEVCPAPAAGAAPAAAAGGDEPKPPPAPESAEVAGSDCGNGLEWIELDTGKEVYKFRMSQPTPTGPVPSSSRKPGITAKRYHDARPARIPLPGDPPADYRALVDKGRRIGDTVHFALGYPGCASLGVELKIPAPPPPPPPGGGGGGGPSPESVDRDALRLMQKLVLPSRIVTR